MGFAVKLTSTKDFIASGLVDNMDVVFRDCGFVLWDYDMGGEQALFFQATLYPVYDDGSVGSEPLGSPQRWRAGNGKDIIPTRDGKGFEATVEGAGFRKGSNFFLLVESLENKGFDIKETFASDLEGVKAHVLRILPTGRENLEKSNEKADGKVLVVSAVHGKVKGGSAANRAAGNAGNAKANAAPASNEADMDAAKEWLSGKIADLAEDSGKWSKLKVPVNRALLNEKPAESLKKAVIAVMRDNGMVEECFVNAGISLDGDDYSR